MRLQDTYKLDTSSVARGELNGVQYSTKLTSNDCFELGRQSYHNKVQNVEFSPGYDMSSEKGFHYFINSLKDKGKPKYEIFHGIDWLEVVFTVNIIIQKKFVNILIALNVGMYKTIFSPFFLFSAS